MATKYKDWFFITAASLLLTGCGFKIHNIKSLPPQLSQVYYQAENKYGTFEISFKKKLKAAGLTLLTEPKKSALIIDVISNCSSPSTNNTSSSTMGRVYDITYTATINIIDYYNKPILNTQTASIIRSITLQPNEVFEATPQVAIIKQEMQQELSLKLLNILSAPNTFRVLGTWSKIIAEENSSK